MLRVSLACLLALLVNTNISAASAAEESTASCVRFIPDPQPFPYPSIKEAKSALGALKYIGGNSEHSGIVWSYYEDGYGNLAVDVYDFGDASPFGPALIWRRPDMTVTPNVMLVSARCESTKERCEAFDRFLRDVEYKKTMGTCPET
jgi:hypothetical protein